MINSFKEKKCFSIYWRARICAISQFGTMICSCWTCSNSFKSHIPQLSDVIHTDVTYTFAFSLLMLLFIIGYIWYFLSDGIFFKNRIYYNLSRIYTDQMPFYSCARLSQLRFTQAEFTHWSHNGWVLWSFPGYTSAPVVIQMCIYSNYYFCQARKKMFKQPHGAFHTSEMTNYVNIRQLCIWANLTEDWMLLY